MTHTFKTSAGVTVRTASMRRFVVAKKTGEIIRRTDSPETAESVAAKTGGEIFDTRPAPVVDDPRSRICRVCSQSHVPAPDFVEFDRRHWHCIQKPERDRISAAWREARAKEDAR